MNNDLGQKYAAIAAQMKTAFQEIEIDEDDMAFNEDENYVFDHLYEAQEHLEAILDNIDNLDQLREKFKLMFPKCPGTPRPGDRRWPPRYHPPEDSRSRRTGLPSDPLPQ